MIWANCGQLPARKGSDQCGTCSRALAQDLASGLSAYVAEDLGAGVIESVHVAGESEPQMERERR